MSDAASEIDGRPAGIILDLRNNGGGLLDQAISVSDKFLSGGEVVSTIGRRPGDIARYNARKGEVFKEVPIVVLINNGSASASEIVAGALQDRGRATVLGMTSFGKGSVQELENLKDGSTLKVSIAEWLTPNGHSIEKTGLNPDVEVAQDHETEEDEQLIKAVEIITSELPKAILLINP